MKQLGRKLYFHRVEIFTIIVVLAISALSHGINMFGFPYYENDEGTYMSQAWAVLELGQLAPYTYWYDHAPAGWLLIALFTKLTGGFFTWGFSINTGRVLMLLLHIASTLFLYLLGKRLSGSRLVGVVAALIYSLTPLGIQYQRRVLLDNIMIFWTLLSFCLIASSNKRLSRILLSAMAMGLAVLSKESAVFFLPVAFYFLATTSHLKNRRMALVLWSVTCLLAISTYPLYALLKQEFFPSGTWLGGDQPHVSLLETLLWQAGRGGSDTWTYVSEQWWAGDPLLITLGAVATLANLFLGFRIKSARIVSLLGFAYAFYLLLSGNLIVFYILPLLPFFALNVAFLFGQIRAGSRQFTQNSLETLPIVVATVPFALAIFLLFQLPNNSWLEDFTELYTAQPTVAQIEAVTWLKQNTGSNTTALIDNYAYIDLNDNVHQGSTFEYYWKADTDPEIQTGVLEDNYRNVDVVLATPQIHFDVSVNPDAFPIVKSTLENFTRQKTFENDGYNVSILVNQASPQGRFVSKVDREPAF